MEISTQLREDAAAALEGRAAASDEVEELSERLEELGVALRPVHPGAEDPLLAAYFAVEVEDEKLVDRVLAVLRESSVVEAAYAKPPAELP